LEKGVSIVFFYSFHIEARELAAEMFGVHEGRLRAHCTTIVRLVKIAKIIIAAV
jgi:hypothetical protein